MNAYRIFLNCATFAALAVAGIVINTDSVNAQQASDQPTSEIIEEIVEVAAPVVHRQVERKGALHRKTETVTLSRPVSYADLDLSKHVDVIVLKNRIEITAKESCEQLSNMSTLHRSSLLEIRRCTKRAIASAEEEVKAAIAAAS